MSSELEKEGRITEGGAEEKEPTVESIRQSVEGLRAKIQAAEAQKEHSLKEKLSEREALIQTAQEKEEILHEAQEAFDYFSQMKELGELTDPEDIAQLETLESILAGAEEETARIDARIQNISKNPAILERLTEDAQKEDAVVEKKKEVAEALERAFAQLDELVQSIQALAEEQKAVREEVGVRGRALNAAKDSLEAAVRGTLTGLPRDSTLLQRNYIQDWGRDGKTEVEKNLHRIRDGFGWRQGKEKAAVDAMLARADIFEAHKNALVEYEAAKRRWEKAGGGEKIKELRRRFYATHSPINEPYLFTGKLRDKVRGNEEAQNIVEAILDAKYSW